MTAPNDGNESSKPTDSSERITSGFCRSKEVFASYVIDLLKSSDPEDGLQLTMIMHPGGSVDYSVIRSTSE